MSKEEQDLSRKIVLIGEPGYRKVVWGERQLRRESSYDSFEEVKEAAKDSEIFQYKELVRREDVEALIKDKFKVVRNPDDTSSDFMQGYNKAIEELRDEVQEDE